MKYVHNSKIHIRTDVPSFSFCVLAKKNSELDIKLNSMKQVTETRDLITLLSSSLPPFSHFYTMALDWLWLWYVCSFHKGVKKIYYMKSLSFNTSTISPRLFFARTTKKDLHHSLLWWNHHLEKKKKRNETREIQHFMKAYLAWCQGKTKGECKKSSKYGSKYSGPKIAHHSKLSSSSDSTIAD